MSTTVPTPTRAGVPPAASQAEAGTATSPASNRQRFLDACHCRPVDHPPVWLMRQAGRALPEYRALKKKHTFLELVQTPDLATKVTLQPIRRFDFDAAILFSDILTVCEGLGQPYKFRDEGGIEMDFLIKSPADVERLDPAAVTERLQYVARALGQTRSALGGRTALLGFAGSPWTLANFMLEGGGVREYTKAKALYFSDPKLFESLFEKLTLAVSSFLRLQIDSGADAIQLFDSLGGTLSAGDFQGASGRWIHQIVQSLAGRAPVIVFAKGVLGNWEDLANTGAQVLGVDWNARLADVRARVPKHLALQGNLDPFLLTTTPEIVATQTSRILREMGGCPGHIFNLGHGVPPQARLENIQALVNTVRGLS